MAGWKKSAMRRTLFGKNSEIERYLNFNSKNLNGGYTLKGNRHKPDLKIRFWCVYIP